MVNFLSCDWGTSSFRLRLVEAQSFRVLAVQESQEGIAATFNRLDLRTRENPEERLRSYLLLIKKYISGIEQEKNTGLAGVPVIISGMASSSIGMANLPYRDLPFSVDGRDIGAAYYDASPGFAHPVLLVSGVRSETDVMRGEETQLIGSVPDNATAADGIYIFPGTHSKHIWVKNGQVTAFKTYMTGELFKLLSEESILREGVEENDNLHNTNYLQHFEDGVRDAQGTNLLHSVFRVRTNSLFGKRSKQENFNYLSGLLIGAELGEITPAETPHVYLCCGSNLKGRYAAALGVLGIKDKAQTFPADWADEAVVRGQVKIYKQFTHST
ncbi:2-dehydro-3-deoxygalactonokinase [Pontibacter saemangeumensis]|uniref:2-dehydro-3-deoxygalactonokinase n=1 Tax=Pontibacter saemangeumensis TaxID=1084525 RepID=A0ABP8LUD6_9BACT